MLDRDHQRGISRGVAGQVFAAAELGVQPLGDRKASFDLRAANGTRVDVKTTRRGMPLMVPVAHAYKLDPRRVDALLLVWDGPHGHELVGQIDIAAFKARCQRDRPFPVPTMYVDASGLEPIPSAWRAPADRGQT